LSPGFLGKALSAQPKNLVQTIEPFMLFVIIMSRLDIRGIMRVRVSVAERVNQQHLGGFAQ